MLSRHGYVSQEELEPLCPLFFANGIWQDRLTAPVDWYWGDDLLWLRLSNGNSLKLGRGQVLLTRARQLVPAHALEPGIELMNSNSGDPFPHIIWIERLPVTGRLFSYKHMPNVFICLSGVVAPCGSPDR